MSVLDTILGGIFDNLFVWGNSNRRNERLQRRGELVPGKIYALKVKNSSDSTTEYVGLDVQSSDGPLRATVCQWLRPGEYARLGADVLVWRRGRRVAVAWHETLARQGVEVSETLFAGRTLRTTLKPGIHDNHFNTKRLTTGTRSTATVQSVEAGQVFGMPTENKTVALLLADGRTMTLKREYVPPYGAHLLFVGAVLPIAIDLKKPDRISIDWPGMAEADAGITRG